MTKPHNQIRLLAAAAALIATGALAAACQSGGPDAAGQVPAAATASAGTATSAPSATTTDAPTAGSQASAGTAAILADLVAYDEAESPGPTEDYYWANGAARITKGAMPAAGKAKFTYDSHGRSSVARASLTYALYKASEGSRQGSALNPPGWPSSNPEVYSTSELTGKTSHTYLWNRSHSIADSLLGTLSYSSSANFTAGTKDQNVGADGDGGMRAAEEVAERYWAAHPDSTVVIWYQTTPLYSGADKIPSGSIVDELSSDGSIDTEVVVLNDEEGIAIDYASGSHTGGGATAAATPKPVTTTKKAAPKPTATTKPPTSGCTKTSSGSCIKKGQFCPDAKHGEYGTDAAGDRLLCEEEGGGTWHWE